MSFRIKSNIKHKKKEKEMHWRNETELIEEWKIRAFMLYCKYVSESAEHEINIDYGTRNELTTMMADINGWLKNDSVTLEDLSLIFDVCIDQMIQFCKFSMFRFKRSKEFETLIRCFKFEGNMKEESPIIVSTP